MFASRSFLIDIPTSNAAAALLAGEFGLDLWLETFDDCRLDEEVASGAVVIDPLPHNSAAAVIVAIVEGTAGVASIFLTSPKLFSILLLFSTPITKPSSLEISDASLFPSLSHPCADAETTLCPRLVDEFDILKLLLSSTSL